MAGERRAQDLLVDDRLLLRDLRLGVLQIGGVGVDVAWLTACILNCFWSRS